MEMLRVLAIVNGIVILDIMYCIILSNQTLLLVKASPPPLVSACLLQRMIPLNNLNYLQNFWKTEDIILSLSSFNRFNKPKFIWLEKYYIKLGKQV